jgi:hypothetical protein
VSYWLKYPSPYRSFLLLLLTTTEKIIIEQEAIAIL